MQYKNDVYIWISIRFALGFILLWAFFDKLFGLGFATTHNKSWILGGSPTSGFLKSTSGPLSNIFHAIAGNVFIDSLFMFGLLCIGLALLLGVGIKIASWSGSIMMILMWLALVPSKNNPLIDEHIIYLIIFIGFATSEIYVGDYYGLGRWWKERAIVKKYKFLT